MEKTIKKIQSILAEKAAVMTDLDARCDCTAPVTQSI